MGKKRTIEQRQEELRKDWIEEEKRDIASRLVETGKLSLDEIAECSRLPLEEVKRLAEEALQPV